MAYMCIIVTVLFTFAVLPLVMKAYGLSYEAQSAAEKILMLHGIAASTIWPVAFTLPCTFRAAGDVKYSMIVSICTMWICRIVFSYVLGKYMGMGVFGDHGSVRTWRAVHPAVSERQMDRQKDNLTVCGTI